MSDTPSREGAQLKVQPPHAISSFAVAGAGRIPLFHSTATIGQKLDAISAMIIATRDVHMEPLDQDACDEIDLALSHLAKAIHKQGDFLDRKAIVAPIKP